MKQETMMGKSTEFGRIRSHLGSWADSFGRNSDGSYTVRRGFYYRHGMNTDSFRKDLIQRLKTRGVVIEILDSWEKYTGFRGGSATRDQSHWGVKFRVISEETI